MSLALSKVSRLKPELRLAQAISAFTADLSDDQKARLAEKRSEALKSPPSIQDVQSLTAEIDRANSGGRCVGPRLINLVGAVQKFASIGDVIIGGSQNIIACGVWCIVRLSLLMIATSFSYLEKLSMIFMNVGRSAPQFESLAMLYPHSRSLQSFVCEYFIIVVNLCHDILNFTKKSSLAKFGTSLSDSSLSKHQSGLESWGRTIKGEVQLLMARTIEDESQSGSKSRDKADKFFKSALYQQQYQAKQRVLNFCSEYDYMVAWKQIRKIGNTSLFRNCPMYQTWKHTPRSQFLIYAGNLGAGKSAMLANLVDDLNLHSQDSKVPVTFFFSRYDVPETLKAQTVFGSIIRQLLSGVPDLIKESSRLGLELELNSNVEPHQRMLGLIKSIFDSNFRTFVVLDGLDEFIDTEREKLFEYLVNLAEIIQISLCTACRRDGSTLFKFRSLSFPDIQASMPDNTSEIEAFITQELERRIKSRKLIIGDLNLILEIRQALTSGSKGMFLWVALQIESLCVMETDEEIRHALVNLPKDLSETFTRILKRSQKRTGRPYQELILELVLVAQRQLTTEELREALSIVPGSTDWHPSRLLNDVYSTLAQCGGLVIVNEEELTISLVHHSFKQYLIGNPQDSSHVTLDVEAAHRKMAEMSITFLNYPAFENQLATSAIPEVQADLAISGIVHATGKTMERVSSLALKILRSKNDTTFKIGKTLAEARTLRQNSENQLIFRDYAENFWDTHLSASFPVAVKVDELLQNLVKRNLLSALSKEDAQALFARSMIAESNYLLQYLVGAHQIDFNLVLDKAGHTPLHMAVLHNDLEFVNFLLRSEGTRPRERDERGWTPLLLAVSLGSFPIFKVLLSIDVRDGFPWESYHQIDGNSIFHLATISGNADIMAWLLDNSRMPILSTDSAGNTPLHLAAQAGHKDIVNMIIDTVFLQMMDWSTFEEIRNSGLKLIEVPLNSDTWKNDRGFTPVELAISNGHTELVKILLAASGHWTRGLSKPSHPPLEPTALQIAETMELETILRFLHSSDDLFPSEIGKTPSDSPRALADLIDQFEATEVRKGHFCHAALILQAKTQKGYTPLHYAAEGAHAAALELLLWKDAILVNSKDNTGRTPLHLAALRGWSREVGILLTYSADPTCQDNDGYTPLHYAAADDNVAVARSLLHRNRELELIKDNLGRSPLDIARLKYSGEFIVFMEGQGDLPSDS